MPAEPLLRVRGLVKHFQSMRGALLPRAAGALRAVDALDFDIADGETLGLVGESGCGKTTTSRLVLRTIEPSAGTVHFAGEDVLGLAPEATWQRRQPTHSPSSKNRDRWHHHMRRTIPAGKAKQTL